MRTLSEILKECDEAERIDECMNLSDYLYDNRANYKKYEVVYGLEHIKERAQIIRQNQELNALLG